MSEPESESIFKDTEHMMRAAGLTKETLGRIENWLKKQDKDQDD